MFFDGRRGRIIEFPSRIEPCLLEQMGAELVDLIAELSAASERLGHRLHPRTAANLAELVRVMNCFYSNLIEGHNTTPREIERALAGDLAGEEERRNLQVEAAAHVRLQREIDRLYAEGALPEPASRDFIRWLHREFYREAPEAMLIIEGAGRRFRMAPGALCQRRLNFPDKCRTKNPCWRVSVISRRVDRGSCFSVAGRDGVVPERVE